MLTVLRQRNFALLWFGQLISTLGDWVLFVGLPVYIYEQTGSALATGAVFLTQSVTSVLLGSIAGVFVDRLDRKRTMIIADLLRALFLLPLLVVRSPEWLWLVYPVAFIEAVIAQFFDPAKDAIIPHLVGEKDLMAANSLNALSGASTILVGPLIGGALMELLGLRSVVLLDAFSFLLSAAAISFIVLRHERYAEETGIDFSSAVSTWADVWKKWLEGLRLVRTENWLAVLFVIVGLSASGQGVVTVLYVVFVKQVLRGGAMEYGWLVAVQGIGGIAAGFIIGKIGSRLHPLSWIMFSRLAVGLIFLAMFSFPWLPLTLALSAVLAIPATAYNVSMQTLIQTGVPDGYRGRILGARATTYALLALLGMGLASILGDVISVTTVLQIGGGLFFMAGVFAVTKLRGYRQEWSIDK